MSAACIDPAAPGAEGRSDPCGSYFFSRRHLRVRRYLIPIAAPDSQQPRETPKFSEPKTGREPLRSVSAAAMRHPANTPCGSTQPPTNAGYRPNRPHVWWSFANRCPVSHRFGRYLIFPAAGIRCGSTGPATQDIHGSTSAPKPARKESSHRNRVGSHSATLKCAISSSCSFVRGNSRKAMLCISRPSCSHRARPSRNGCRDDKAQTRAGD